MTAKYPAALGAAVEKWIKVRKDWIIRAAVCSSDLRDLATLDEADIALDTALIEHGVYPSGSMASYDVINTTPPSVEIRSENDLIRVTIHGDVVVFAEYYSS